MDFIQSIILGAIQGITEFFPISSTAHLVLLPWFLSWKDQGLPFNRLALRSQINGGMLQALSYGLFEQRVHDPDYGLLLTANLEDYRIAGMQECAGCSPLEEFAKALGKQKAWIVSWDYGGRRLYVALDEYGKILASG